MKNSKFLILFAVAFITILRLVAAASTASSNVEVTEVSPTSLIPGEPTKLEFKIENTGDLNLDNLIFSWEEKTGNILSGQQPDNSVYWKRYRLLHYRQRWCYKFCHSSNRRGCGFAASIRQ